MNIIESIEGLGMKPCSKCGDPKELSNFRKRKNSKDGYQSQCKLCRAERDKEYREANKEQLKEYYEANKERHAERVKEYYEANKERYAERAKEWREANKERRAERGKEYYEANKERRAERVKEYYEANKERIKEYYEANKERHAERYKEWFKANPDKARSFSAKRRSAKLNASPPWITYADKAQIQGFYTLAIMQNEATCKEYHVDHIHPLQAPKVVMFEGEMIPLICGLHVLANLQILEASANCSKSNKFEPYIESECDFTEPWQVRSDDRAHNPNATPPKPRKPKAVTKGQLALF